MTAIGPGLQVQIMTRVARNSVIVLPGVDRSSPQTADRSRIMSQRITLEAQDRMSPNLR